MKGMINSVQTLGALDGPGIRFVIFMQGCVLRCACCHNPDTWEFGCGKEVTVQEMIEKILRYKSYFGKNGGVTVSGGEALCQAEFVTELFKLCHENGINTCLDTSGCILNDETKKLLSVCDLVLLDVKYTNEEDYLKYVGGNLETVISFLDYLCENEIPSWIRQVIIKGKNDSDENIKILSEIIKSHKTSVEKAELLAFRKLCSVKYENLKFEFPFGNIEETDNEYLAILQNKLDNLIEMK